MMGVISSPGFLTASFKYTASSGCSLCGGFRVQNRVKLPAFAMLSRATALGSGRLDVKLNPWMRWKDSGCSWSACQPGGALNKAAVYRAASAPAPSCSWRSAAALG